MIASITCILITSCTNVTHASPFKVISHPDGMLYVGDQVSFEVLVTNEQSIQNENIDVTFNGIALGSAPVVPFGIGGRKQATLWWIWDTRELKPGNYTISYTLNPGNTTWTETFSLHPAQQIPSPEPEAHWVSTITVCCNLHYISGTAAERDITAISQEAEKQSASVSAQMGASLSERMNVTLMSRVVGQGGFTTSDIYVSYLDNNYVGNDLAILFHHEFVHYYDRLLGGSFLPAMLAEGLAVYLSGGHFKLEHLGPRAAALLDLGWYIPLNTIADDFYNQQHDIGYLEAGSLVQYMIETYGWEKFNRFYRSIPAPENQAISVVMDSSLQSVLGISFNDLEHAFLDYLHSQPVEQQERTDLQLTVAYFDTVRHYQEILDPSAYFLTAWLPDGSTMRHRGIVADLLRHPEGWKNRLIESLLIQSEKELYGREYVRTGQTIKFVNWIMDLLDR